MKIENYFKADIKNRKSLINFEFYFLQELSISFFLFFFFISILHYLISSPLNTHPFKIITPLPFQCTPSNPSLISTNCNCISKTYSSRRKNVLRTKVRSTKKCTSTTLKKFLSNSTSLPLSLLLIWPSTKKSTTVLSKYVPFLLFWTKLPRIGKQDPPEHTWMTMCLVFLPAAMNSAILTKKTKKKRKNWIWLNSLWSKETTKFSWTHLGMLIIFSRTDNEEDLKSSCHMPTLKHKTYKTISKQRQSKGRT